VQQKIQTKKKDLHDFYDFVQRSYYITIMSEIYIVNSFDFCSFT